MKISSLVFAACLAGMALHAPLAYCNPPQDIAITISGSNVDVTVTHPVSDPSSHYIKTVTVSLNGVALIQQTFSLQTGDQQVVRYTIPGLKKGDGISVKAECSRFGSLERTQKAG